MPDSLPPGDNFGAVRSQAPDADWARFTEPDYDGACSRLRRLARWYVLRYENSGEQAWDEPRPGAWTLREIAAHVAGVQYYAEQMASQADDHSRFDQGKSPIVGVHEQPGRVCSAARIDYSSERGAAVAGGTVPPIESMSGHADVAQLVEHHLAKVRVAGSNPVVRSEVPGAVLHCCNVACLQHCESVRAALQAPWRAPLAASGRWRNGRVA
jgi:hypothetical protein